MSRYFFTSYARLDNLPFQGRNPVTEAMADLRNLVAQKLPEDDLDAICFFDESDITVWDVWEQTLITQLNTANVLVCFLSEAYVTRPHCAKEFDLFRRRLAAMANPPAVIVPILWERTANVPAVLDRFQRNHDSFPREYWQCGLRALLQLESQRDAYFRTIDRIAAVIVDRIGSGSLPPLAPVPTLTSLSSAFHNPTPGGLQFVVACSHESGLGWRIGTDRRPVAELVDRAARSAGLGWRERSPEIVSTDNDEQAATPRSS